MNADRTVVDTSAGTVRGLDLDGVLAWRGLPYAEPPLGELRHRPPQPVQPWTGVRGARRFAARAMQPVLPAMPAPVPVPTPAAMDEPSRISENCLYLNVCAPARPGPHPVLVWVHGGGYVVGAGPEGVGDGDTFARRDDLVVVTFNYRLGAFGFLNLGESHPHAANAGLLDQIAALRWVRENIAAFGGDPHRVTIAGNSAGAKSVANLMAAPAAAGLFHGVISQSGGGDHVAAHEVSAALAGRLLTRLGVEAARLGQVPAAELLAAQTELSPFGRGTWVWRPTVDGAVVPDVPVNRVAAGSAAGIPLLAGSNSQESALYLAMDPWAGDRAPKVLTAAFGETGAQEVLAAYRANRPGATSREINAAVMTDERYGVPTVRLLDAQSAHAPVWRYRFEAAPPWLSPMLAAAHGTEQPYVWAHGAERRGSPLAANAEAAALSNEMHRRWAAFVRTGRPQLPELADWPEYTETDRLTLVLDNQRRVAADPGAAERKVWDGRTWSSTTWFG
ncbi:para-nitrobenzyl esterase [Crossiella equi]|uniref:Carboxylic ester hydrolase n=1 Tax=Crossiella equi TaxID=130796 RepID=A0ABS5A8F3_9PSEU|nr:carboxylesterase family protein [Crossiella equi]MBP2472532.1 para-nitrobenzyl esterase [Crossiella equi]